MKDANGEIHWAVTKRYTENNEAYEAYLKGRLHVDSGPRQFTESARVFSAGHSS